MTIVTAVAALATLGMLYVAWGILQEIRSPSEDAFRTPLGRLDAILTFLFALAGIGYLWASRANAPSWFLPVLRVISIVALLVGLTHLVVMVRAGKAKGNSPT